MTVRQRIGCKSRCERVKNRLATIRGGGKGRELGLLSCSDDLEGVFLCFPCFLGLHIRMELQRGARKGSKGQGRGGQMKRRHTRSTASALLRSHALALLVGLSSFSFSARTTAAAVAAATPSRCLITLLAAERGGGNNLLRMRGGAGAADTAEIGRVCGSDDYYEILGVRRKQPQKPIPRKETNHTLSPQAPGAPPLDAES